MRSALFIGLAALLLSTGPTAAAPASAPDGATKPMPMRMHLVRLSQPDCGEHCPEWVALAGRITSGDAARFRKLLAIVKGRRLPVLIDSPGGSVEDAIAMGRLIRARALDVQVGGTLLTSCNVLADRCAADRFETGVPFNSARCASACPLILAGGVHRAVPGFAEVGLHKTTTVLHNFRRLYRTFYKIVDGQKVEVGRTLLSETPLKERKITLARNDAVHRRLEAYFQEMGVSKDAVLLMEKAEPESVYWLSHAELASTALATAIGREAVLVSMPSRPAPPAIASFTPPQGSAPAPATSPASSAAPPASTAERPLRSELRSRTRFPETALLVLEKTDARPEVVDPEKVFWSAPVEEAAPALVAKVALTRIGVVMTVTIKALGPDFRQSPLSVKASFDPDPLGQPRPVRLSGLPSLLLRADAQRLPADLVDGGPGGPELRLDRLAAARFLAAFERQGRIELPLRVGDGEPAAVTLSTGASGYWAHQLWLTASANGSPAD